MLIKTKFQMCVNLFIKMFKISVYKEEIYKSENQR